MRGRTFWGNDYYSGDRRSPSNAEGKASANSIRIKELELQVEGLSMKCQAMWELLKHAGQVTDEHLFHQLEQIDLRDGQADGKMTPSVAQCPDCQRKTSTRRPQCLYCGCKIEGGEAFATTMPVKPRKPKSDP